MYFLIVDLLIFILIVIQFYNIFTSVSKNVKLFLKSFTSYLTIKSFIFQYNILMYLKVYDI